MHKKRRLTMLVFFLIIGGYVLWKGGTLSKENNDSDGIVVQNTVSDVQGTTGGVIDGSMQNYRDGTTGVLEVKNVMFPKGTDVASRTNPAMGSYVLLRDIKTDTKIEGSQSQGGGAYEIAYGRKVISPNVGLQINVGKNSTSNVQFCLDDTRCTRLVPTGDSDAVVVFLGRYLKPGTNIFLVKTSLEGGEQVFLHTVRITYLSQEITYNGVRVTSSSLTGNELIDWSLYDACYKDDRYEGDDAQVNACVRKVKDTLKMGKDVACSQPDGPILNRYLDITWGGGYGEVFGWIKQNNTLYYSVNAGKTETDATCESPAFEVHLFAYDCSRKQGRELYQFPKVGIAAGNCGVTIAGAADNTLIYRKNTYEGPYNGIYEGFEALNMATKQVVGLSFMLMPDDAKSLGVVSQLSEEDRAYIRDDVKKIATYYRGQDPIPEDIDAGGFVLHSITGSGMTLDWVFDNIIGPDGVQYTMKKSYDLQKISGGRKLKK